MKAYEVEKQLTSLLENEAKRIMDILMDMYKEKTKVNKSFDLVVNSLIKKEFKPYGTSILSKVISLIPLDLMICPTNEWIFITEKEYCSMIEVENASTIKNGIEKNNDLVNDITRKIIANYKSNDLNKKNILEVIYDYIPQKELTNIDSEVLTCMIKSIVHNIDENYDIINLNPLAIKGL